MVWQSNAPDGSKSVLDNETILQQNTIYIEDTMAIDHFWNFGTNEDGHHQFVQTQATNDANPSLSTNPTLATGMDLVYYSRFKTSSESTAQQDCQPFALNNTDVMQILGIRACVVFNVSGSTPTIVYKHNVTSVTRTATGKYTIAYTSALPSNAYLVQGGGIRSNTDDTGLFVGVQSNTTVNGVKSTSSCRIICVRNESSSLVDPLQAWVFMFGG